MAKNSQKFIADIAKLRTDYIDQIDKIRSKVNIFNPENLKVTSKFAKSNIATINSKIKIENTYQESRAHAFLRLIGFPVVSNDNQFYSPGLDKAGNQPDNQTYSINDIFDKKIKITNGQLESFKEISEKRETYFSRTILPIFSKQSIESTVLALSSGFRTRRLNEAIEKTQGALDLDPNSQSYEIDYTDANENPYSQYTNQSGESVSMSELTFRRFHILKPFIVDGRIDLTTPSESKVAVPFVNKAQDLVITNGVSVQRPLIEKVIQERFNTTNQISKLGESDKELITRIKQIDSIQNETLLKQVFSGDIYKLSEQLQFSKYLDIIVALIKELTQHQFEISRAQSLYYYVPIISKTGPENGVTTQGLFIQDPNNLKTKEDIKLFDTQVRSIFSQPNMEAVTVSNEPDKGGFVLSPEISTLTTDTSAALGNNLDDTFDGLKFKRNKQLDIANKALTNIELIVGEFSGLGLIDIIAIIASLYIVDKKYLLGLIDERAYTRMQTNKAIATSESQPDIITSLEEFDKVVKGFYDIINKVYIDINDNNRDY